MALLLICPDLSPSSSAQQPGSFSLAPLPKDVAQLSPAAHTLFSLASLLLTCSLLSPGRPASCAHRIFGLDLSPHASSSFPYSPLASFGVACSSHTKQDFVFSWQLVSKLRPRGVLLFLNIAAVHFTGLPSCSCPPSQRSCHL